MRIVKKGHTWIVNVYDLEKIHEPISPDMALIRQHVIIAPDEATACHKFLNSPGAGEVHRPGVIYTISKPKYVL